MMGFAGRPPATHPLLRPESDSIGSLHSLKVPVVTGLAVQLAAQRMVLHC